MLAQMMPVPIESMPEPSPTPTPTAAPTSPPYYSAAMQAGFFNWLKNYLDKNDMKNWQIQRDPYLEGRWTKEELLNNEENKWLRFSQPRLQPMAYRFPAIYPPEGYEFEDPDMTGSYFQQLQDKTLEMQGAHTRPGFAPGDASLSDIWGIPGYHDVPNWLGPPYRAPRLPDRYPSITINSEWMAL